MRITLPKCMEYDRKEQPALWDSGGRDPLRYWTGTKAQIVDTRDPEITKVSW